MPQLADEELDRELRDSRSLLGPARPALQFLAYPYGDDDERVYRAAERAGYEGAFSLRGADRHDRFAVPRVDIYRKDKTLHVWLKTSFLRGAAIAVNSTLRRIKPG